MSVTWECTSEEEREARHRAEWGDKEYERRKRVAAEKVNDYPDSEWEEACVMGGQFEAIAMQAGQHIFDQLETKSYKFWAALVTKLIRKR